MRNRACDGQMCVVLLHGRVNEAGSRRVICTRKRMRLARIGAARANTTGASNSAHARSGCTAARGGAAAGLDVLPLPLGEAVFQRRSDDAATTTAPSVAVPASHRAASARHPAACSSGATDVEHKLALLSRVALAMLATGKCQMTLHQAIAVMRGCRDSQLPTQHRKDVKGRGRRSKRRLNPRKRGTCVLDIERSLYVQRRRVPWTDVRSLRLRASTTGLRWRWGARGTE